MRSINLSELERRVIRRRQEEGRRCEGKRVWSVDPEFGHRSWTPLCDATAVPLDEVVRQDRPGVKITYRGNLSETGSISRRGGWEEGETTWNKNARRVGRTFSAEKEKEKEREPIAGR